MQGIFEEAVTSREGIILTSKDRAIWKHQSFKEFEVVFSDRVTDIDRTTGDGARGSMEGGARVSGLEHIPIRMDEVAHPQTVVCAVHHVASLQPKCTVWISRWISAPKVVTYQMKSGNC